MALVLVLVCVLGLAGCVYQKEENPSPTGYPSGEIQQPQLMYNEQLYFYFATGFDESVPDGYIYAGVIEAVDNQNEPEIDFHGAKVELGQEVYADENNLDSIYIKYDSGYAEFKIREYVFTDNETEKESPADEIPGATRFIIEIRDRAEKEKLICAEAEEMFYEDENNEYYFNVIKSHYIMVTYNNGNSEDIVSALNAGRITISDLDEFGIEYHTQPKRE